MSKETRLGNTPGTDSKSCTLSLFPLLGRLLYGLLGLSSGSSEMSKWTSSLSSDKISTTVSLVEPGSFSLYMERALRRDRHFLRLEMSLT